MTQLTSLHAPRQAGERISSGPPWLRRFRRKLVILDAFAGVAGSVAVVLVRYDGRGVDVAGTDARLLAVLLGAAWVGVLAGSGGYERRVLGVGSEEFRRVVGSAVRLLCGLVLLGFVDKADLSRSVIVATVVTVCGLSLGLRWLARKELHRARRRGRCLHRTLLVGSASDVAAMVVRLRRVPYAGYSVVAACLPGAPGGLTDIDAVPVIGVDLGIAEAAEAAGADTIAVLGDGGLGDGGLRRLGWSLESSRVDLLVAPGLLDVAGPRLGIRSVEAVPLLEIERPTFGGPRRIAKGAFDRIGAVLGLLVLALPLAALAAAVRLSSPGPAFFRQVRVGQDGRTFRIWKLRTMIVDAERSHAAAHLGNDADGLLFKLRRDPRVTPLGAWLRRWSLDELPQLLNVASGEMSLVGPRPPLPSEVAAYGDDVRRRLLVKPGLTGLWQVNGRSDLPWEECVRLDLFYVENWSFPMDLVIILRTLAAAVRGSGAY
ncbi:MAG TPA: sugar transferase [Mycobacteriales bacterium]|nr:sugar transferase [Mycobacteriales bacterium]